MYDDKQQFNRNKKGVASLYGFIVSLLVVSLVVSGFIIFTSHGASTFAPGVYKNESMEGYAKMAELNAQVSQLEANVNNVSTTAGEQDILGSIVTSGYQAARTQVSSFSVFQDMLSTGFKQLGLPISFNNLIYGFIIALVVMTITSILLMYVLKLIP